MHPRRPFHHRRRRGIAVQRATLIHNEMPSPEGVSEWITLGVEYTDQILSLLELCEAHDKAPYRSSREDVLDLFATEIPHASHGALNSAGELVAFGMVRVLNDSGIADARCSGAVNPQWRDMRIGSTIVEWQLEAGRALLAHIDAPAGKRISRFCEGTATDEIDLLERVGFTAESGFTQMRRDLNAPITTPDMSQHLRIEPWGAEWSEMIREASEEPEAQTEDGRKLSEDDWERMHTNLVPEWSAVVIDRSTDRARLAGYIISARWEADWDALGWSEGYINALGILGPWRKQRVGQALATYAMRRMRKDGMEFAGIDIGSDDGDGVADLCETLGFEPTHTTTFYTIEI